MQVNLNIPDTMAIHILKLMHVEVVRLLKINYTTQDEDEQADSANDAAHLGLMMQSYEAELVASLGKERVDLAKENFARFAPFPTRE